jgi:regulator of replication initiation timing
MKLSDMAREADAQHSDSIHYWRQRHSDAVDRWVKLDSQVLKLMRENEMLKRENTILRQELKHRISSDILCTEAPHLLDMTKEQADAQAEKEITWMVAHNEGAE